MKHSQYIHKVCLIEENINLIDDMNKSSLIRVVFPTINMPHLMRMTRQPKDGINFLGADVELIKYISSLLHFQFMQVEKEKKVNIIEIIFFVQHQKT